MKSVESFFLKILESHFVELFRVQKQCNALFTVLTLSSYGVFQQTLLDSLVGREASYARGVRSFVRFMKPAPLIGGMQ